MGLHIEALKWNGMRRGGEGGLQAERRKRKETGEKELVEEKRWEGGRRASGGEGGKD